MTPRRLLTTKRYAELADTPLGTVTTARDNGTIAPAERGRPGTGDRWTFASAVALASARLLKSRGVSDPYAFAVYRFIEKLTPKKLDAHVAAGRRVIVVVGFTAFPQLVSREEFLAQVADKGADMAALGLSPWALDIGIVVAKLKARLADMDARDAATPPTRRGPRVLPRATVDPAPVKTPGRRAKVTA